MWGMWEFFKKCGQNFENVGNVGPLGSLHVLIISHTTGLQAVEHRHKRAEIQIALLEDDWQIVVKTWTIITIAIIIIRAPPRSFTDRSYTYDDTHSCWHEASYRILHFDQENQA